MIFSPRDWFVLLLIIVMSSVIIASLGHYLHTEYDLWKLRRMK